MSHTKEPWIVADHNNSIVICFQGEQTPHGTTPYFAAGGALELEREANARRIVACVNACAGMSQQYIEELNGETLADRVVVLMTQRDKYSLLAYRRQNTLDEVINQRDELLAELQKCAEVFRRYEQIHLLKRSYEANDKAHENACLARRVEAVIASVKGGA